MQVELAVESFDMAWPQFAIASRWIALCVMVLVTVFMLFIMLFILFIPLKEFCFSMSFMRAKRILTTKELQAVITA
jgi:hypothetical protein